MRVVVRVHPGAQQGYNRWRNNLPGWPSDRNLLLGVYLEQIARDALAQTAGKAFPCEVTVRGPHNSQVKVQVRKLKKDLFEVIIGSIN
jgi:hypothetical protein